MRKAGFFPLRSVPLMGFGSCTGTLFVGLGLGCSPVDAESGKFRFLPPDRGINR